MIGVTATSKYGPPLIGATVAVAQPGLPVDMPLAMVISAGMIVGIMFRAGLMIERREKRAAIMRDLGVSLLIGGMNLMIAVNIILMAGITSHIQALGIAAVVAASGVQSGMFAVKWIWRKMLDQEVADLGGKREQ